MGNEVGGTNAARGASGNKSGSWMEGNGKVLIPLLIYAIVACVVIIRVITVGLDRFYPLPPASLAMITSLITFIPLALTVGVFYAYRNVYLRGNRSTDKVLSWGRYALPLFILNMLVVFSIGILLSEDIKIDEVTEGDKLLPITGFLPGIFEFPLYYGNGDHAIYVPGMIFYIAYAGFFAYTLQATYRRFISGNLVPHFYLSRVFNWIYVTIVVLLVFLGIRIGDGFLDPSGTADGVLDRPEFVLLLAFVVGFSPVEWFTDIISFVRKKVNKTTVQQLPLILIDGIDYNLAAYLEEENIDSVQSLLTVPAEDIHKKTKVAVETIKAWKLQARLLSALGSEETIRRFRRLAVNDFNDLAILEKVDSIENKLSEDQITTALSSKDEELPGKKEYWAVLLRVLYQTYKGGGE